ncbi:hypothetical protein IscW_ISCW003729 [Ixodes scapularis]|uniref:C2H2-type domain-containing protein n=1 Tax=Ixodes scapularis TaxID=6945 RepID=B7PJ34_IXOSC|nr:hypothetical protein IscW_ISCW003729 [Ixodes scapularis]|eukprot:XP_002406960.1 hypothetical protein IscW_ISCW003729 [Ixodes scapularis]
MTLLCLYCEKTFKDWQTLKEHMRKKQHKHINPKNSAYDKYYVVNYADTEVNEAAGDEHFSDLRDSDAEEVYYFPTYENDQLLCALEDENCAVSTMDDYVVPEDLEPPDRLVLEALRDPEPGNEVVADRCLITSITQ